MEHVSGDSKQIII